MYKKLLVAGSLIALMVSAPAWAIQELDISKAQYFPAPGSDNRDRGDNMTALLLDDDTNTFSYTTSGYTSNANGEQCVGVSLGAPGEVSRVRIYKAPVYGGLDIWVYYTTDTDADLGQRTWQPVTGLTNGYEGNELIDLPVPGTTVSGNKIEGELHTGWFSVTCDPVYATGIAIGFLASPLVGNPDFLHVQLHEWELYGVRRGASAPTPSDEALGVSADTDLGWTPGVGLTGQNVYFGLDPDPNSLVASGDGTLATVSNATLGGPFPPNTTYFWRVDGEATPTDPNTYPGIPWSFTTSGKAGDPTPADDSFASGPSVVLSWTGGSGMEYDVYFGTDSQAMSQIGDDLAVETTQVDSLADVTEYFWRVDTYEAGGGALISLGDVWSFTTTGLYHHWKIDEPNYYVDPSKVHDFGPGGATGTISDTGVDWVNDSERGWCLDFSGTAGLSNDGMVTFFSEPYDPNNDTGINLNGKPFTVSIWGKKDNAISAGTEMMFTYDWVWFGGAGNAVTAGFWYADLSDLSSPAGYYNDKWNMYTVTFDNIASVLTLYINGYPVNSALYGGGKQFAYGGDPLWTLGKRYPDLSHSFDGRLQDTRVYLGALSDCEVLGLYVTTTPEEEWVCCESERPAFDLDGNCKVDLADFADFAAQWLACGRLPVEACN
jgi:hypothetical protein